MPSVFLDPGVDNEALFAGPAAVAAIQQSVTLVELADEKAMSDLFRQCFETFKEVPAAVTSGLGWQQINGWKYVWAVLFE